MNKNKFPPGWNEHKIQEVLNHYEMQTEDAAALEDAAVFEKEEKTLIEIPSELLPIVREMLAGYYGGRKALA